MKTKNTGYRIFETTTIAVIGFFVIPPLMKMVTNKLYKYSLTKEPPIDFDSLGPVIVKSKQLTED